MYAEIRRYRSRDSRVGRSDFDELRRRLESRLAPVLLNIYGFHSYYLIDVNDRELVSVAAFDYPDGVTEFARRADEFLRSDPLASRLGPAEVADGEVLLVKEAVGSR